MPTKLKTLFHNNNFFKEVDIMTTAKEIALKILSLPEEEEQNVPLVFEYYNDSESSVPIAATITDINFYQFGYPIDGPHIVLSQF